ncbi:MAG: threonylcarbamoyl-AMP synthase, partial [Candidatus Phytoplasma sp.]|nr:threonylcarbamoyl-AMP synthase [Phytoplasma sp.]
PSYYEKTGEKTIGVRIPNHLTALKIIKKLGPMKTTSMNQSGEKELNDYQEIKDKYGHLLNKVYPNDQEILKIASTVVLITDEIKILREGSITKEMIVKSLKK